VQSLSFMQLPVLEIVVIFSLCSYVLVLSSLCLVVVFFNFVTSFLNL